MMGISVILTHIFEVHCKLQLFLDHKSRLYLPCKRVPKSLQHHWCFSSGASRLPLHPTDPRPKLTAREPGHFQGFGGESGPRPSYYLHFSGITETSGHTQQAHVSPAGTLPQRSPLCSLSRDTPSMRTSTSPAFPSGSLLQSACGRGTPGHPPRPHSLLARHGRLASIGKDAGVERTGPVVVRGVTACDAGRSRGHDRRRLRIGQRALKPWSWPIPAASASGGRARTQVFPSSELRAWGRQCRPHHRAPTGGSSIPQATGEEGWEEQGQPRRRSVHQGAGAAGPSASHRPQDKARVGSAV